MPNLPNLLTLVRIAAVPALIGAFYLEAPVGNWVALGLFGAAALTDLLDGAIARARGQTSDFGRVLDPIADKLLVAAALVMLLAFDRAPAVAVILILGRELLITGLREWLSGRRIALPVSRLAKWKTATQMAAIGLLLIGEAGPAAIPIPTLGEAFLWLAALLTWVTAIGYLRAASKQPAASAGRAWPEDAERPTARRAD